MAQEPKRLDIEKMSKAEFDALQPGDQIITKSKQTLEVKDGPIDGALRCIVFWGDQKQAILQWAGDEVGAIVVG
ncbi:MAG: hypothetical protein WC480_01655 [Patescibacteria group bacterium]